MRLKRNFLLVLSLCFFSIVHAYDYTYVPDITTFDKDDYQGGRQNWDIEVDADNVIYVANSKGLLRYVFGQWILDELPSGQSLRSICVYENKVWCGGDEIGFFDIDEAGNLAYKYLADINGNVWNIEANGENVFFQSNSTISVYNIKTESLVQYTFPNAISGLAKWQNEIWTISTDKGLGTVRSDGFSFVKPFTHGQNQEVRVLFEHGDELYIVMMNGEVFAYDGHHFKKINMPEQSSCFSATHYDENTFYLGSILEGIIPVKTDKGTASVQRKIKERHGLLDNTVLSLGVDNNGNLWAGLDYGIAKINKESLLKTIISKGATYDLLLNENTTYVATNKGLFANYQSSDFSLIAGTQGQVWALNESASGLFAGHNNGLMKIEGDQSRLVYNSAGVMDVAQFGDTNHYLFSAYTGTLWMQEVGGEFQQRQNLGIWGNPKLKYDKANQCVWVHDGSADTIVHRVQILDDSCAVTKTTMKDVFSTDNGLFFYDGNALFEYTEGGFNESRMALTQGVAGEGITALEVSSDNNIAVYIQNNEVKMIEELANGSTVIHDKLLSEVNNDILEQFECLKIHEKLLYIATDRGVKILPLNNRYNSQSLRDPIISKIEITYSGKNRPQAIYYPFTNKELNLASREFKTITLSFAKEEKHNVEYRYRLLPYNKEWTKWSSSQTQVVYGDLRPRKYTFELECRYNGAIERKTSLPIIIEGIGYYYLRLGILFVILAVIALVIIQYAKNHKLRLKHKQYKKLAAEEQIQAKKQQLLQFTEIIRHKNSFLVEVRGALAQMKNSAAARWVNKIDQEINKEKKEFLFHKLFSEDHQDFIQRISAQYEELTPHDIRLISFIRINANTSEIAQFLNISNSSVDTARYRLRKKLDLEPNQNLDKFIREFQVND
jgi:ligand-binding sensor domain-containing protein